MGSCILVSSSQNMKLLKYSKANEFTNLIRTSHDLEINGLVFFDSSNQITKISMFFTEYAYSSTSKFKFYLEEDIKKYLDKYGPDSLFMRMSSYSNDFVSNILYIYGFKEKYYLYTVKHNSTPPRIGEK